MGWTRKQQDCLIRVSLPGRRGTGEKPGVVLRTGGWGREGVEVVTVQIGTGVELLMRSGVGSRMLELGGGVGGGERGYMFVSGLWISADEARVLEGEGIVMGGGGGGGGEGGAAARKTLEMMEYVLLRREFLCMCILKSL